MKRPARLLRRFPFLLVFTAVTVGCNGPDVRGPFEGQIVDAADGRPIEGAVVVVVWTRFVNWEAGREEIDAHETVSSAQGRWQISERPTSLWEAGPFGLRRRFYVFAPEYAVLDPAGTPRDEFAERESTITTMRRLVTREEQCKALPFVASSMSLAAAEKSPRFQEALERERVALNC